MLYTAILFGLISSFHCVGMCGPIALMLPVGKSKPAKKVIQILTYHLGRITAYGTIGFVFGLLGKGFYLAGIQQRLSIFIGIIIILIVLTPESVFAQYNFSKPIYKLLSILKSKLGKQFRNSSFQSLFTIGLLNGFLPCGMVYVALFGAIATQSAGFGVLYMILFGIGTIPLMSTVIYLNNFITVSVRTKIRRIIPVVAVIIGLLFILRGLGLGIPYVSPTNMNLIIQQYPNCH